MFSSVELVAIDDAFACASNQGSLEGKLLFVREGYCLVEMLELMH